MGRKELDMTEVTEYVCSKLHYVCHALCTQILLRMHIASIPWITEKATEFQKNIYFYFIDYIKASDCVDYNKLWEILQEMGIPDHLTGLLRNVYTGQEATVRTEHGTAN